ncbi:hypothetical protein GN109_16935 [Collimonas pratensis]|uniref:hypothetical protein n=1 Tax=Collimonas pratensis TaxID=279113 RepID=UPI00143D075B|nr:hypothetical protein [Collimonas pratensis]NKI71113.1 hypothetical protein [Collimonas pratensis]
MSSDRTHTEKKAAGKSGRSDLIRMLRRLRQSALSRKNPGRRFVPGQDRIASTAIDRVFSVNHCYTLKYIFTSHIFSKNCRPFQKNPRSLVNCALPLHGVRGIPIKRG